jgi:hypothetical protein
MKLFVGKGFTSWMWNQYTYFEGYQFGLQVKRVMLLMPTLIAANHPPSLRPKEQYAHSWCSSLVLTSSPLLEDGQSRQNKRHQNHRFEAWASLARVPGGDLILLVWMSHKI